MDSIRFKCPRCGNKLRVPIEKAGHHGRCPTCGARIKVPEEGEPEYARSTGHAGLWVAVGVAVVVLIVVGVIILSSGEAPPKPKPPSVAKLVTESKKLKEIKAELIRLDELEEQFDAYRRLIMTERRLRARDVRTRLNNYEAVSLHECELRRAVLAAWEAQRGTAPGADASLKDDWKLNTPLSELERGELHLFSDRLTRESHTLADALAKSGIRVSLQADPLHGEIHDTDEVAKEIAAKRDQLSRAEAKLQQPAHASAPRAL